MVRCDVLLHKGTTGWLRLVDGEAFGLDSSERLRCSDECDLLGGNLRGNRG